MVVRDATPEKVVVYVTVDVVVLGAYTAPIPVASTRMVQSMTRLERESILTPSTSLD